MPAPHPPEFRRRAIDLARQPGASVAQVAKDLGISESGLRRWLAQDDIDAGRKEGLSSKERRGTGTAAPRQPVPGDGDRDSQARLGVLRAGERAPKIGFRLVQELAADGFDVAVVCRVLKVSRSGYYEWRNRAPSNRDVEDAYLANTILDVHVMSCCSYGAPRVHAELRLGQGVRIGRKRVARLLRLVGRRGISHRHKRRHKPAEAVHEDLVQRKFTAAGPDLLWCTDITEHPTRAGKVYCCAVEDVFTRQVVGWSIADHMRSDLVVDALQMAIWRRRPQAGTVVHAGRGSQYTSWVFGHRLRDAGLLGSMGRVASSVDNSMIESFWSTMQRELLDTRVWETPRGTWRGDLRVDRGLVQRRRRHTALGMLSPIDYETQWRRQQNPVTAIPTAAEGAA